MSYEFTLRRIADNLYDLAEKFEADAAREGPRLAAAKTAVQMLPVHLANTGYLDLITAAEREETP